jgi:hypothetical protein
MGMQLFTAAPPQSVVQVYTKAASTDFTAVEGGNTTQCPLGGAAMGGGKAGGCPVVASILPFEVIGFDKVTAPPPLRLAD